MRHVIQLGICMMLMLLVLTSCASTDSFQKNNAFDTNKLESFEVRNNKAEVTEGDYIFRLVSAKETYTVGEEVELYGELTYIGDQAEVVLQHASEIFLFPMTEKVRNYEISTGMNDIAMETILIQNEPYEEKYTKNGVGYLGEDPKAYRLFIENFMSRDDFPAGYYEVHGEADFYVDDIQMSMKTTIDFKVVEE